MRSTNDMWMLITYLQVFYSCFPKINFNDRPNNKSWITIGIRISYKRKKELLYLYFKNQLFALKYTLKHSLIKN